MSTPLFSGKNAYEHLRVLCEEIGPRHGGSKEEKRAACYIRDYFRSLGLEARLHKYPIYTFRNAESWIRMAGGEEIPCTPIGFSGDTPPKGVTREAAFLENPSVHCLDESLKDRVVIVMGDFDAETKDRLYRLQPAGLILIQSEWHSPVFTGPYQPAMVRKMGRLPSVRLRFNHGMHLLEKAPRELTLCVRTHGEKLSEGHNAIAELRGAGREDEVVVVGAHYDSVYACPGAVDNGSGTAAMMEMARVFASKGSLRPLRFIAFSGEEMGLHGAKEYVKGLREEDKKIKKNKDFELDGLKSEMDRIRFMVNFDMLGTRYGTDRAWTLGERDIAASLRLLAAERRFPMQVNEEQIYSSDNMAFNYAQIPSASFARTGGTRPFGHSTEDTIDLCCAEALEMTGRFCEAWMERYVTAIHHMPFARRISEDSKGVVDKRFKDGDFLDRPVLTPERKYKASPKKREGRK